MESRSCDSISLSALICAPLNSYPAKYTSNPIILSTVKIWRQFRRHFKLASLSPLMPICDNHIFLPSALDPVFSMWKEKGLVFFKQLFIDKVFASFDNLKTKFDLPRSHLFRYFQILDFARCNFPNFPHQPPDSFIDTFLSLPVVRGIISMVGKLIISSSSSPLVTRNVWEKELGTTLSAEWWQGALDRVSTTSSCASLTVIQFKVLHGTHLTKVRLKLFNTGDMCDRCSLSLANHSHTFFSCPKLVLFL